MTNYTLEPTSEVYTTSGSIIELIIPDNEHAAEDDFSSIQNGFEIYDFGYCDASDYSIKYHLLSGNPDQYKIEFADKRFEDVDWTDLATAGKEGTIDLEIPADMPNGNYEMVVTFRDSRYDWLESEPLNVIFHINLDENYVVAMYDNVIALVDTCNCFSEIQWYHRASSTDTWEAIPDANGYYVHTEGKLSGEYFVKAKMNDMVTYTCPQTDVETLFSDGHATADVNAYPNPVLDYVTVTIKGSDAWTHDLRVVNLMGAEVEHTSFDGDETAIDMGVYPQGNYMISVDGIVVKVIKK